MAQEYGPRPRFEDTATADVRLRLLSTNRKSLTLRLHSQVLRRSEYFEARISERWNLENKRPLQLTLANRKNIAACKRCIELMYAPTIKHASFTSVQDALDVLEVADELLFHECINAGLDFLECVPWTAEDEMAIRSSSLASCNGEMTTFRITADLATRLFMSSGFKPLQIMEDRLRLLFSKASGPLRVSARENIYKQLTRNVDPSVPSVFAGVNEVILHEEWDRNLELLKAQHIRSGVLYCSSIGSMRASKDCINTCASLEWLLELFLFLKIADNIVKTLAEEDLPKLLTVCNNNARIVLSMLYRMLRAFQSEGLIISRSVRFALVKNWLPILPNLIQRTEQFPFKMELEEGICALTKTLPQVDQSEIFKIWFETCLNGPRPWPDLQVVFDLSCDNLRQELQVQQKEQESSVKDNAMFSLQLPLQNITFKRMLKSLSEVTCMCIFSLTSSFNKMQACFLSDDEYIKVTAR